MHTLKLQIYKMHPLAEQLQKAKKRLSFKGTVGITTFIKKTLMQNIKYVPPKEARIKCKGKQSTQKARRRGLFLGRKLDKALQEYVEKGTKSICIAAVLRRLRCSGLTLIAVQVPVVCKQLKIKTFIDGIAVNAANDVYVVELKNTQMTVKQHEAAYSLPALKNNFLTNGLKNSEFNRHGLQAYFGVIGMRECYSIRSRPIVIINCANGVRLQRFDQHQFHYGHFT